MKIKINKKERFDIYIKNRKTFGITQEGMKTTLLCSLISATLAIQPALGAKKEVTLSEGNPAEISEKGEYLGDVNPEGITPSVEGFLGVIT